VGRHALALRLEPTSRTTRRERPLLAAVALALLGAVGFMAFARRDHKVELIVTYAKSPPSAVWRLLTDHASEPRWLPAFGSVTREAEIGGHEVWTHTSPDRSFTATVMTVSAIPETRYERLLLRDTRPRSASWDGRWIYELRPDGDGTRLTITEYGWTDGFPFYLAQRVLGSPDTFLQYYARMIGRELNDPPTIQTVRSH
jgi:uncharacterized protein YndB with AHSA1/START domain